MHCETQASNPRAADWAERIAIGASAACLVHCAGLPLVLAALPMLSKLIPLSEDIHLWLLALAVPMSGSVLVHGIRSHGLRLPLLAGTAGLSLLVTGVVVAEPRWELLSTIAGSICLIAAHAANWRLRRRCPRHG